MRSFLWGGSEGHTKVAWVRWEDICKPKEWGGLGIKDWGAFNKALIDKWRWRLLHEPNSLWGLVLREKYVIPNLREHVELGRKNS